MHDSASTSANTIPVIASTSFVFSFSLGILVKKSARWRSHRRR
jgi:hypothetical protein